MVENIILQSNYLKLVFKVEEKIIEIKDNRTGKTFISNPIDSEISEINKNDTSIIFTSKDNKNILWKMKVWLDEDSVEFAISSDKLKEPLESIPSFPPSINLKDLEMKAVFCDRSCGLDIKIDDSVYGGKLLRVYGNTQTMDMPWIGIYDSNSKDGYMLLVKSEYNAIVKLELNEFSKFSPKIIWDLSMGALSYERRASYVFIENNSYIAMAKRYREYAKLKGRLVTLNEKAIKKPLVNNLKGAPVIWGDMDGLEFVQKASMMGLKKGIISNCHIEKEKINKLTEMGFLTGEYDSIGDILEGPTDFQRDNIETTAYRIKLGEGPMKGWKTLEGLQYYMRSSGCAMNAVEKYVPKKLAKYPHTSRFVDVAAALDLFEDYHPDHTFSREGDKDNRRKVYEYLDSLGLVIGTEHGNDWIMDIVDYFEGSTSGSLWWEAWPAGHLVRPKKEEITKEYFKYGMGEDTRIPLWELVYHDCAVTTWYWGDTPGFVFEASSELSDKKDLYNMLYGTVSLLWRDDKGYGFDRNTARFMKTINDTSHLHESTAFKEMKDHKILSKDYALQQTIFEGDLKVTVNFSKDKKTYISKEKSYVIAPFGYLIENADIIQSKMVDEENIVTRIIKKDFTLMESEKMLNENYLMFSGRVLFFKNEDFKYNLVLFGKSKCKFDYNHFFNGKETIVKKYDIKTNEYFDEEKSIFDDFIISDNANTVVVYEIDVR